MARRAPRSQATQHERLDPQRTTCVACEQPMWVAYHAHRTITTLHGVCRLTVVVRSCRNEACPRYQQAYRPEEEGGWALPHGECGLDVIVLVGTLRYREHRSIPEIHRALQERHVLLCERTVEHLLHRYEELVSVHLQQKERVHARLREQGRLILALDGLQPDVGHELCHFHYLREAAKPIYEADRHAKKELKKRVRGIRTIERSLEGQSEEEAQVVRDYCLAARSALTDDGQPPLCASGLRLQERLQQISDSIERVAQKRGCLSRLNACSASSPKD